MCMNMENHQQCDIFTGPVGKILILGFTSIAFVSYTFTYYYRKHHLKTETRTNLVFFMDLSKMGLGQGMGFVANIVNAHRNAGAFDPLSYYLPTFISDELFGVPLGVLLGRYVNRLAASSGSFQSLHEFGVYSPISMDSATPPRPLFRWWLNQLLAWMLCVFVSRMFAGLIVPFVNHHLGTHSPFYMIALWIYELEWSCDTKRWVFVGAFRIVIDLLQIAFVDYFNKSRTLYSKNSSYSGELNV